MDSVSGVGVLDKAMAVLGAARGRRRARWPSWWTATGLSRPTAHRLAVALEAHGLVRRDDDGRFCLGLRLIGLGHEAAEAVPVWAAARPALAWLHEQTGESRAAVRARRRRPRVRRVDRVAARAAHDRPGRGSAAAVGRERRPGAERRATGPGWPAWRSARRASPACRPRSATGTGRVVAAVSVSGPLQRLTRKPGQRYGAVVAEAAARAEQATVRSG